MAKTLTAAPEREMLDLGRLPRGRRLRVRREALGLRQGALARLIGVSADLVSRLEGGQAGEAPYLRRIADLADAALSAIETERGRR